MAGDVCFGCGTENPRGLKIRSFWDGDETVCIWTPEKHHQGWANLTCGGIIATLIDCHCMASAMAFAVRNEGRALGTEPHYRFATGTLNIKFLKPTPISDSLTLRARLKNIRKKRIYTFDCKLDANAETTAEAEVVAFLVYSSNESADGDTPYSARSENLFEN